MSREDNIKIFNDTKKIYNENNRLKEAISNTINNTQIILENEFIETFNRNNLDTKIIVNNLRSYEAARKLIEEGCENVCVHNFASATNPGGGVLKGSSAQEECLCRISTLYPCISTNECFNKFYNIHRKEGNAIHNDDIIYSPKVMVFKSDTQYPKLIDEKDWIEVNVITCAAPNLRENPNNQMNQDEHKISIKLTEKELYDIHVKRLKRILDVAYFNGNDGIVIGAFGCGAFKNNPKIVARATKDVVNEYMGKFRIICLAIYCNPKDTTNYQIFKNTIK